MSTITSVNMLDISEGSNNEVQISFIKIASGDRIGINVIDDNGDSLSYIEVDYQDLSSVLQYLYCKN